MVAMLKTCESTDSCTWHQLTLTTMKKIKCIARDMLQAMLPKLLSMCTADHRQYAHCLRCWQEDCVLHHILNHSVQLQSTFFHTQYCCLLLNLRLEWKPSLEVCAPTMQIYNNLEACSSCTINIAVNIFLCSNM